MAADFGHPHVSNYFTLRDDFKDDAEEKLKKNEGKQNRVVTSQRHVKDFSFFLF